MPAFKKFGPVDQVDNVLVLEPRYDLASGSGGWRGSPEGSASLSLYGGIRRSVTNVVPMAEYQVTHNDHIQAGSPVRANPMTASVHFVYLTNSVLPLASRGATRWGDDHWSSVQRLYDAYAPLDPDFVTGSYDYYSLFFQKDSKNVLCTAPTLADGSTIVSLTGSFTLESWIKPLLTSSATNDFTVYSITDVFGFGITGSNGRLFMSSSRGVGSASLGPTVGEWSHVAFSFDSTTLTGTFYVNLTQVGTMPFASALPVNPSDTFDAIGNVAGGSPAVGVSSGSLRKSFHGLIGETRSWPTSRTHAQISGTYGRRLTATEASTARVVFEMNEGPLAFGGQQWSTIFSSIIPQGSGAINWAATNGTGSNVGFMTSFGDRNAPVWHPNDNINFRPSKRFVPVVVSGSVGFGYNSPTRVSELPSRLLVIDIPSAFYGRQISPGSVSITDRSYSGPTVGLVRTLIDDGRGGLFISGSITSSSLENREDYRGVEWNKVGNVFYGEGLIVIKDPSLLDFGGMNNPTSDSSHPEDVLQLSFRGTSKIPVKTLMCRIDRGEFNCSSNPTFRDVEDDGSWTRRYPSGSLRVSTVGIYNSDRELVGVARLADPVRVRDRDRINIKLRMDF